MPWRAFLQMSHYVKCAKKAMWVLSRSPISLSLFVSHSFLTVSRCMHWKMALHNNEGSNVMKF